MKFFLYIVFSLFFTFNLSAQSVYFGYPTTFEYLATGDKIITRIPSNRDGRFLMLEEFDNLIALLEAQKDKKVRIEINMGIGSSKFCLIYTNALTQSLGKILKDKNAPNNYELIGNGKTNPLFQNTQDKYFRKWHNNRIEIIILDK